MHMKLDTAISLRRSIRKFKQTPIDKEVITTILKAGIQAPSAKNKQHWRFHVFIGKSKNELTKFCLKEFDKIVDEPDVHPYAKYSFQIMEQAPVVILVFDSFIMEHPARPDIQSVSAAIQNMLLKATDLGIGSLWICDILYIDRKIQKYIETEMPLLAAVAFGYANQKPGKIKKLSLDEVTTWH